MGILHRVTPDGRTGHLAFFYTSLVHHDDSYAHAAGSIYKMRCLAVVGGRKGWWGCVQVGSDVIVGVALGKGRLEGWQEEMRRLRSEREIMYAKKTMYCLGIKGLRTKAS